MSPIATRALSFTCLCLLAATTASGQSYRTISVGVGLGHLTHGVGNQPLRLSNDAMAIVSDGSSEGLGAPDDAIVIIRGFESGLLSTSFVSIYTALGIYGDLPHNLVRLDDRTLLYVDRGLPVAPPSLVVVLDAGNANLVTVHALPATDGFDVDTQPPAVLDSQSLLWTANGPDKVLGTADDRIGFAFGLGTATCVVGTVPALGAVCPEIVAVSNVRAVARSLGADGVRGTPDDAVLILDHIGQTVRVKPLPTGGLDVFTASRGPVPVGNETLVYRAMGGTSLYTAVRRLLSEAPEVIAVGSPVELPPGVSLVPEPVGIARDSFVYANAGPNRLFHDADDQVRVVTLDSSGPTIQTFIPGFALGLSDTSIPPASLGEGRVVFASDGADAIPGTFDDGVVVAEQLLTTTPGFTLVSAGGQMVSMVGVNANTVAMQSIDSKLSFYMGLGTATPTYAQFVTTVSCGACFGRLNDWTLLGSVQVSTDSSNLLDDVVTVQFPFIELIGTGQVCSTGQPLTIVRDPSPVLGTTWPATLAGGITGNPAALLLSWYPSDLPLNAEARFYLDYANLFSTTIATIDYAGRAKAYFYLEPLPWLTGFSFCGQWGTYDPQGYAGLCVSGGFRAHF